MLHRISWRVNGDGLDVALAANRMTAFGYPVWWSDQAQAGFGPGDYAVDCPGTVTQKLADAGIVIEPVPGERPENLRRLMPIRAALLAGDVSAYPYFAFYALSLLRLGIPYVPVGGDEIACGALDQCNLLVLPGGFSIWGIDAGENVTGADLAVRAFMHRGGACLGSCGGAFYLSSGRPGWTGTAPLKPRFSHEYLQTGAAIVSVALAPHPLTAGLSGRAEIPYYHGPVYETTNESSDATGTTLDVVGRFSELCLPSRLMIENPLDADRFAREIKGSAAILRASGPRGNAVLFSPHPEMGDLVRKYIALDGYVRRYLPVRGQRIMADTLRHYRPGESPAFRLVLNAAHVLASGSFARYVARGHDVARDPPLAEALRSLHAGLQAEPGDELAELLGLEAARLGRRIEPELDQTRAMLRAIEDGRGPDNDCLLDLWPHLMTACCEVMEPQSSNRQPIAERLMNLELALELCSAWRRFTELELILGNQPMRAAAR